MLPLVADLKTSVPPLSPVPSAKSTEGQARAPGEGGGGSFTTGLGESRRKRPHARRLGLLEMRHLGLRRSCALLILGLDHRAPNSISLCFASLGFHFLAAHGLCARGQSHKDAPKKGVGAACPGHG